MRAEDMSEDSDKALLARHVAGDGEAFGELVRRHRDRLWAVALRTLGDREEAADAVQDALVSAYRAAHTFRGQSAVTTWLHRITVNACLDRARKAASRRTSSVDDTERFDELIEPHEAASAPAERNDLHRELFQALRTLTAEQRAALVLVDMQGYSVAEAAKVLGVAVGTVKSRCARGRARLLPLLTHLRPTPPGPASPGRSGSPAAPSGPGGGTAPPAEEHGPKEAEEHGSKEAGRARNQRPQSSVPPPDSPAGQGPADSATVWRGGGRA
ncbi:RNA polymerase sigma factor SigM [Streptomyces sp. NPDC050560]|uniref:RNA polymerase sigma factor SigM n=1 Tax=Streptomyces sp. NPDC050560 TaxID=3365630 RepID=UPI00379F46D4